MAETVVRVVDAPCDLDSALEIRAIVFIQGQAVPAELEVDGLDPQCTHLLAERFDGERWTPVGTARLRQVDDHAKAERVAVLPAMRGLGIGDLLMRTLQDVARAQGFEEVHLNAQLQVVPFYERLGYQAEGPEFEEAGIQHRAMRRRL